MKNEPRVSKDVTGAKMAQKLLWGSGVYMVFLDLVFFFVVAVHMLSVQTSN